MQSKSSKTISPKPSFSSTPTSPPSLAPSTLKPKHDLGVSERNIYIALLKGIIYIDHSISIISIFQRIYIVSNTTLTGQ